MWKMEDFHLRHAWCQSFQTRLDLNLLTTCKQLYDEAGSLLWSTNTFSFFDLTAFEIFMGGAQSADHKLRNIHIQIDWWYSKHACWSALVTAIFSRKLDSLHKIQLTFTTGDFSWFSSHFHEIGEVEQEALNNLKALPPKHVTIVIANDDWPLAKRQERAEDLRRQLLNSDAYEASAAEFNESEVQEGIGRKEEAETQRLPPICWGIGGFSYFPMLN